MSPVADPDTDDLVAFPTSPPGRASRAPRASVKDRLRADLARRKAESTRVVEISFDDTAFRCFYRLPDDGEELAEVSARADKRGKKDGTAGVWFNRLILAKYNVAMSFESEDLTDADGTPWTFASPDAQAFFGASSSPDCVRAAYVSDGQVAAAAAQLLSHAGFGDRGDVEVVEDPTRTASTAIPGS